MEDESECAIVHHGQETRCFDYKGPCAWDSSDQEGKEACCALTKHILAMANTPGGGQIVIGVSEEEGNFVFEGLTSQQLSTWETTKVNNFVNNYAEPRINCTLRKVQCAISGEKRDSVIITVPPFSFTPHITKVEYKPLNKPSILLKATLYIRTANNASEPLSDAADFSALIERAIKMRRGEMVDTVLVILPDLIEAINNHKNAAKVSERERSQVMRRAERLAPILNGAQVLWVDDYPENNLHERRILRSLGIFVDLARSTDEAISMLKQMKGNPYDLVISDMERAGIKDEGLRFLSEMRKQGIDRPTIFYLFSFDESRGVPVDAFAITARPDHLLHYVMDVLERERG